MADVGGVPPIDRPLRRAAEFYGKGNDDLVCHRGRPSAQVQRDMATAS